MDSKTLEKPRMKTWKIIFLSYLSLFVFFVAFQALNPSGVDGRVLSRGELAAIAIDGVIADLEDESGKLFFLINPSARLRPSEDGVLTYRIAGVVSRGIPRGGSQYKQNFAFEIDAGGVVRRHFPVKEEEVADYTLRTLGQ